MCPRSAQPGQHVFASSQLDLQPCLSGGGVHLENAEDYLLPVDRDATGESIPVPFLRGGEIIIEGNVVDFQVIRSRSNFIGLAGAHKKSRSRRFYADSHALHGVDV